MTNPIGQKKARHPAEIYNEKRRILLAKAYTDPTTARAWLENYRTALGPKGYAGMQAELAFFEQYARDYQLTPALDVGDATDFCGVIDGKMYRVDVTTNLDYKALATYEPFQAGGSLYKIALFDGRRFELVDVNFPFCGICGSGRVLPTAALLGENRSQSGDSLWSNDQLLVEICGSCGDYRVADRATTSGFFDFEYWYGELNAAVQQAKDAGTGDVDVATEIRSFAGNALRYLSKHFGQMLMGVGGSYYEVTNPRDGDGHWRYHLELIRPLAAAALATSYDWDIDSG